MSKETCNINNYQEGLQNVRNTCSHILSKNMQMALEICEIGMQGWIRVQGVHTHPFRPTFYINMPLNPTFDLIGNFIL